MSGVRGCQIMETLRVIDFVDGTSVDGPGLRTAIYFAGCAHGCDSCHNPQTWDFKAGEDMSVDEILDRVERNGHNVTLTGGDPIYQSKALTALAKAIRGRGYNIWCYTGFTYEQLFSEGAPEGCLELLDEIDVLVDGPFVKALREQGLRFRGSSNQRIIDLRATPAGGPPALHPAHYGPEPPCF